MLQFCTEFSLITLTGSIHDPKPETGPGRCREHAKARDRRHRRWITSKPATSGEISKLPRARAALPLLHRSAGSTRRCCPPLRGPRRQLRCCRENAAQEPAYRRARPRLAIPAPALCGEKYLQARFQFGRGRRPANTDDACFQTRYRRHDPPVLGIRPCLGRKRSGAASSRCGDHRAILEYVRSAARRAAGSHGAASI